MDRRLSQPQAGSSIANYLVHVCTGSCMYFEFLHYYSVKKVWIWQIHSVTTLQGWLFHFLVHVIRTSVPRSVQIKAQKLRDHKNFREQPTSPRYYPSQLIATRTTPSKTPKKTPSHLVMGIPNPPFGTHRRREHPRYISGFHLRVMH